MTVLENADGEQDQVTRVVAQLIRFFNQRGYETGERLPSERDLSARFKVTRSVVREALKSLEWMRYIDRRPNSGIYMRGGYQSDTSIEALVLYSNLGIPFGRETDLQCLEVRRLLEVQAIQLACERRDDEDIAKLRSVIERSANERTGGRALSSLDFEFHMTIFEATKNIIFVRLVTPFYLMSERRRTEFFTIGENFRRSYDQHVAIVDALQRRERTECADLMAKHIGHVEHHFSVQAG